MSPNRQEHRGETWARVTAGQLKLVKITTITIRQIQHMFFIGTYKQLHVSAN
jgi:hypothetical protein